MIERRLFVHAVFVTLAPIIVAWFGLSVGAAVLLTLLLLLWRWVVVISGFVVPEKTPDLVLAAISASHFVEKVRWSMDRLGVDYVEKVSGGTLGAFFLGRTVPQLKIRTGSVRSSIGNSAEILRYLWGRYAVEYPDAATFLEPSKERVELEARLDQYGVSLQVWAYYHLLDDREATLHLWGANNPATPLWQRYVLQLLFPVQRFLIRKSFRITQANYERSVARIDAMLGEANNLLEDGRQSLLGGNSVNYTDVAFAAMTGLWLMPPGYGGGKADGVRIERDKVPSGMQKDTDTWRANYARVTEFVERLYRDERIAPSAGQSKREDNA
ncbi:MAG: glutathione S-transferase domain-containing protein [Gammaproteobacteria bacterium]|nr:glutathione S-transferase domain-containing protein [Gammaproteobacteria bacterium]NNC56850.1 glutathione S-transferase domain-containing protein [Woeseiaceae bacterium]NNL50219.1 glutathione S-transferase domain-containing protein [Woeseiaceae bacterium]